MNDAPTTYHVAMLDRTGRTLAEDSAAAGDERQAKALYRRAVTTLHNAGYADEVHAVALIRVDDARRRSVLASTAPTTARARGQARAGL